MDGVALWRQLVRERGPQFAESHYLSGRGVPVVEVLLVGVHPHLGSPDRVLKEVGPRVRGFLWEDVTHMGTWVDFQGSATLPHLEGRDQWQMSAHQILRAVVSLLVCFNLALRVLE